MESVTYWAAGAWLQKECFSCREEEEVEVLFEVRISVLYVSMERAQWGQQLMRQLHSNHLQRLLAIVSNCESRDWAATTVAESYSDCKEAR